MSNTLDLTFKVRRFDPDSGAPTHWDDFPVKIPDHYTILDTLIDIREYHDSTLALRCSCRSAICGSCNMTVNGMARLACKTKVIDVVTRSNKNIVTIEPAGNMPVIKDLIVDQAMFWERIRAVDPTITHEGMPKPEREYLAPNSAMLDLTGAMNCILCGACVSACTVLEIEEPKAFLGPAALAKAYRFVGDPRDSAHKERLEKLSKKSGIWDCTHCFMCVEVCPKGVAPMERILQLRDKAMAAGFQDNNGSRHSNSFAKSVKHSGRLNETQLLVESLGYFNIPDQIKFGPTGLRALKANKMPPILHKKIPSAKKVEHYFEKLDGLGKH